MYSCLENESQNHPLLSAEVISKIHRNQFLQEGPLLYYPLNGVQLLKTSLGDGVLGGTTIPRSEGSFKVLAAPPLAASLQEVQSHPEEVPPGNRCVGSLPLPLCVGSTVHSATTLGGFRALLFVSQALLGTPPLWGLSSPEEAPCPHSSSSTSMDTASMGSGLLAALIHTEPRLHPLAPPNRSSRALLPSLHM